MPVHRVEWALEWTVHWLRRAAVLDLLQFAASLSIPFAVLSYCAGAADRETDAVIRNWQVIGNARGERRDGARDRVLEALARDNHSLERIGLAGVSVDQLDLRGADLTRADMDSASLVGTHLGCRRVRRLVVLSSLRCTSLTAASLRDADLTFATLPGARLFATTLVHANLTGVSLTGADLTRARLDSANMGSAMLDSTNLTSASLVRANLSGATFTGARLTRARLDSADLSLVTLNGVDLRLACLAGIRRWDTIAGVRQAHLKGVRGAPAGFIAWALREGADTLDAPGGPSSSAPLNERPCAAGPDLP
ncbi:MAG TPA: pentapeptide repeat-containing protein [Gemmatimonadaceae bacterium]|nr:pentapeptide repeat-containing protein [Gemmatimonadaceae bacterium]